MKIVFKDFCTFTGVYTAIYMGRIAGPTSYLSENFELPKCWTSEVPHPRCPISNCFTIQIADTFFSLVREPTCLPYILNLFFDIFRSFPLFTMIEFWVLALHNFYNVFADWYFSWLYFSRVLPGFFSLALKKRHREKSQQKIFLQTQSKISVHILFQGKMQFLPPR